MLVVIGILIGLAAGAGLAFVALYAFAGSRLATARRTRQLLLSEARREADAMRREAQIEAREESVKLRAEVEQEVAARRSEIVKIEERLLAAEEEIDRKLTELTRREQGVSDRETHSKQLQDELKQAKEAELRELERISGMTTNEAKAQLLGRSEELIRHELARRVRQLEEEAQTEAKRRARNLVADALQRVAANHAAETTVSVVELPSDDMKGRIIGREVAKLTLAKLIEDGRIHPARIEEMYYQSKAEIDDHIRQAGEQAVFEANCGEFHEELVKILGRLRFRTSYGQNVLKHTLEVVHLAAIMASEVEASVKTVKRAAMLHDIGKAMSHEVEGSHAAISAQLARRYGEALQAGREIRVIVHPGEVDDDGAVLLSHEIAREIEDHLEYPGQVKVTVIRESRAIDVARNVTNGGGGGSVPLGEGGDGAKPDEHEPGAVTHPPATAS